MPDEPQHFHSTTKSLIRRAKSGDLSAFEHVFSKLLQPLRRWAHGRLPRQSRAVTDTVDVVQDAAMGVWRRLDQLELSRAGDLDAYVRQAVLNRIRDEARRADRSPELVPIDHDIPSVRMSPLEEAMGREAWGKYRKALGQLPEGERELIVSRLEYGYSYEEVASLLGRPSPHAARMAVNRALAHLLTLVDA